MILKQIELVNFQTIKNFSKSFEGNVYFVTGENELGKSTLLKAIAILLTGSRDEVLTLGEDKGFAKAIIGEDGKEYEVELRFTKANPKGTLTIKDLQSGLQSDKISTLQEIFGYSNFDAQEFIQWSDTAEGRRKQVAAVKSLLPANVQTRIRDIDSTVETLKNSRADDNRELKMYTNVQKEKQLEITEKDETDFAKPFDLNELLAEQTNAVQLNEQIKGVQQRYDERKKQLESIPGEIEIIETATIHKIDELDSEEVQLKEELARKLKAIEEKRVLAIDKAKEEKVKLEALKVDLTEKTSKAVKYLAANKPIPMETIQAKMENATTHNAKHQKVLELKAAKDNVKAAELKMQRKNDQISTLSDEREKLIKESKLPVDGLSFTDEGLILNEISFSSGNVSDSQIMEVVARLIMAKNPTVKVFRIGRGESLGAKRLKAIIDFAKKNGYQGFIEQVVRGQNELIVEQYSEV